MVLHKIWLLTLVLTPMALRSNDEVTRMAIVHTNDLHGHVES